MKYLFVLCSLFLCVNLMAKDKHLGVESFILDSVLGSRCERYLHSSEELSCFEAVETHNQNLNFDVITLKNEAIQPEAFVFVAFKIEFITLLTQDKTTQYLNDLNRAMNDHLLGHLPDFNLWDFTLKFTQDKKQSAKILAILFQDTSLKKLHLAYLEKANIRGRATFDLNRNLLSRVIDTMNLLFDYTKGPHKNIFYPKPFQNYFGRNIYHFYVPMYSTIKLMEAKLKSRFARMAPLLLTLSYEFLTMAPDYRYVFEDPSSLQNENSIQDIYASFCGSHFAINESKISLSLKLLEESFNQSTRQGVQFLFGSLN